MGIAPAVGDPRPPSPPRSVEHSFETQASQASRARQAPNSMQAVAQETPPEPMRGWSWPPWVLNSKQPCIEVFAVDDDSGEHRWCAAEPQTRVQDKSGNDAYLQAEYEWDGEFYVQDFGPQHVRRRGETSTVQDYFKRNASTSHSRGPVEDDLDKTKVVRSA